MRKLIIGLAALAIVAAACGDDDDTDATSDALSKVCENEAQVLEDVQALAALDPATNTTSDYQDAADALQGSIEDLGAARDDLGEQDVANVESAYDSLQSELEGLDDVALAEANAEAASAIDAQADELQQLYQTAYANSSCASSGDGEETE